MTAQLFYTDSNPLCNLIAQHIAKTPQQRITFAEYMELVLYHPQHGYYVTHEVRIGAQGDFFTSPHLGADFGELLASQFAQMWVLLDRPRPFTLLEMGAGQGLLVQDISRYLHHHHFECFEALEYIVVERSSALIAEQQRRLAPLMKSWGSLSWKSWEEIPSASIIGCCFSNELVDAFPVHQVMVKNGRLQEIYVTVEGDRFTEVTDDLSTPQLKEYFDSIGISLLSAAYLEGYRTEVNLVALDWLKTVGDRLQKGYLLTIDYGYPATRYYSPGRDKGTLQCYYSHAHHSDPYLYIGQQDITAHVDFTTLEQQGDRCGLQTIGFTQQGLFLMALGLGDRLSTLSSPDSTLDLQDLIQRREALHLLMNPMGLGNFGVLIQGKGFGDFQAEILRQQAIELKGLSIPGY
jgi:SAM-dependent MidA family methyltransferase